MSFIICLSAPCDIRVTNSFVNVLTRTAIRHKEEILQQFLSARRQEKCPENPERDEKKNQ